MNCRNYIRSVNGKIGYPGTGLAHLSRFIIKFLRATGIGCFAIMVLACCIRKEVSLDDGSCTGWIVGNVHDEYGTIFYTINDGFDWQRQGFHSLIPEVPLYGVSSLDAEEVWVCGPPVNEYGLILYSDDRGYNWVRRGNKSQFRDVSFRKIFAKKPPRVWITGNRGWVGFTMDNGNTWTKAVSDSLISYTFHDITCSDSGYIWVIGYDSTLPQPKGILLSTDMDGLTWYIRQPVMGNTCYHAIFSCDDTTVWLSTGNAVFVSTDKGDNWNKKVEIPDGVITGISASSLKDIWLITNTGKVLHSENSGKTWISSQPFGLSNPLTAITTAGGKRIWITGRAADHTLKGIIIHSRNAGKTWYLQEYPGGCGLNGISFAGGNR